MRPETIARKVMRQLVKVSGQDGMVVGTQYLCTDCRVRFADKTEKWIKTGNLTFIDRRVKSAVDEFVRDRQRTLNP